MQPEAIVEAFHIVDDFAVGFVSSAHNKLRGGFDPRIGRAGCSQRGNALKRRDYILQVVLAGGQFGEMRRAGGFQIKRYRGSQG